MLPFPILIALVSTACLSPLVEYARLASTLNTGNPAAWRIASFSRSLSRTSCRSWLESSNSITNTRRDVLPVTEDEITCFEQERWWRSERRWKPEPGQQTACRELNDEHEGDGDDADGDEKERQEEAAISRGLV